jgi:hypothetical protein
MIPKARQACSRPLHPNSSDCGDYPVITSITNLAALTMERAPTFGVMGVFSH